MTASDSHEEPSGTVTESRNVPNPPVAPAVPEPANTDDEDNDSALGDDDAASITTSLRSIIFQYRQEHGRTYHGYLESIGYVLPNDNTEQDRLDLQHHLFRLTLQDKLYLCPAGSDTPLRHVLDAGTGTGNWAMDLADEQPQANIVGVDLSPIQPSFVPPNASFIIDDLEQEWAYPEKFDLVFARMLTGSIADWPKFMAQSFENLESGGWVEVQDIVTSPSCNDDTLPEDSYIRQWANNMCDAAAKLGRHADSALRYKDQMREAGFINIHEVVYKWPTNPWPADAYHKDLGLWVFHNIASELSGLSLALFTRSLGWSREEVIVFLAKVREEMKDKRVHAWWPIHVVFGQKP